jgi:hypothetical protein
MLKKNDFVVDTLVPVLVTIMLTSFLLTQLKAAGIFPASSDDKQWIDDQIEQHPDLFQDNPFVYKWRNAGLYFSEGDRDLLLRYMARTLRNQSDRDRAVNYLSLKGEACEYKPG